MSTSKPSAATGQQAATTLQQRLIKVVTHVQVRSTHELFGMSSDKQFAWFIGHVVLLSCAARYWLAVVTFKSSAHVLAYRSALVGSVATCETIR
ncbi:Transmembrane nucleoporin [Savitreella phatthalungensis]